MISVDGFEAKFWTFPGGERSVKLTPRQEFYVGNIVVRMAFKGSDDLMDMMLTVNALRNMYGQNRKLALNVPYLPFSRQDRVMTEGESFGLQAAVAMINLCNFDEVTTMDVHSDVASALFPAGVFYSIPQEGVWKTTVDSIVRLESDRSRVVLISPDAGALKKIYKLAKATDLRVVEAKKIRDVATGQIVKTDIEECELINVDTAIIVDDICDGGRTFVELAKEIRRGGYQGDLILCVTHGIFSKGLDVFKGEEGFDRIYTMNNINDVDLVDFNRV
jgi:ribose-phosphate pyrophosphokinase